MDAERIKNIALEALAVYAIENAALTQENLELLEENERLYRMCHPRYWLRTVWQRVAEATT